MGSVALSPDVTLPDAVVPKREFSVERYSSSSASTPEAAETAAGSSGKTTQEPTPAPKRKGGRKPVSSASSSDMVMALMRAFRYMQRQRNGSRGTVKLKRPSVNDALSTSNNWRQPSSTMKRLSRISSRVTVRLPTSV